MSKIKPILFYTFMRGYSETGYKPMAVTTVKGDPLGSRVMYYGTDIRNECGTHTRERDTVGKFETLEMAQACIGEIAKERTKHAKLREPHRAAIMNIERDERIAIDKIIESHKTK